MTVKFSLILLLIETLQLSVEPGKPYNIVMIDDDAVVGGEFVTDRLRFKAINRQLIYHHRAKLGVIVVTCC